MTFTFFPSVSCFLIPICLLRGKYRKYSMMCGLFLALTLTTESTSCKQKNPFRMKGKSTFYSKSSVYSDTHSLFRFVVQECIRWREWWYKDMRTKKELGDYNGREWERRSQTKGKSFLFTLKHGSWKGFSGDEYECLKTKCPSQYRDSAGTQAREESIATPTQGGVWLLAWVLASSIFRSLGDGHWQYEHRAEAEYRCALDQCSPKRGSGLTSESQSWLFFVGHSSNKVMENELIVGDVWGWLCLPQNCAYWCWYMGDMELKLCSQSWLKSADCKVNCIGW